MPIYKERLYFYKGGKGFYNAGDISPKEITDEEHKQAAEVTYDEALAAASSGDYDLVICDEIINAVHDGLLEKAQLETLIRNKAPRTSLCLTGRDFPADLLDLVDIATEMKKLKHHFDDKYLANKGIDF
jgi:cob(I)alamin adenosyltransferase